MSDLVGSNPQGSIPLQHANQSNTYAQQQSKIGLSGRISKIDAASQPIAKSIESTGQTALGNLPSYESLFPNFNHSTGPQCLGGQNQPEKTASNSPTDGKNWHSLSVNNPGSSQRTNDVAQKEVFSDQPEMKLNENSTSNIIDTSSFVRLSLLDKLYKSRRKKKFNERQERINTLIQSKIEEIKNKTTLTGVKISKKDCKALKTSIFIVKDEKEVRVISKTYRFGVEKFLGGGAYGKVFLLGGKKFVRKKFQEWKECKKDFEPSFKVHEALKDSPYFNTAIKVSYQATGRKGEGERMVLVSKAFATDTQNAVAKLSVANIEEIDRQALTGIKDANAKGVNALNDIKPENIGLDFDTNDDSSDSLHVKFFDLDMARMEGTIVGGTQVYLPPDEDWSKMDSKQADVYALGVSTLVLLVRHKAYTEAKNAGSSDKAAKKKALEAEDTFLDDADWIQKQFVNLNLTIENGNEVMKEHVEKWVKKDDSVVQKLVARCLERITFDTKEILTADKLIEKHYPQSQIDTPG